MFIIIIRGTDKYNYIFYHSGIEELTDPTALINAFTSCKDTPKLIKHFAASNATGEDLKE